jgi:Transcriptional regulatory protein, C terminal
MAIYLDTYLQMHGFHSNPFASTSAEQEKNDLPSYFVRVNWFDLLIGNPCSPESIILFAPQGYGKTSHCIEMGRIIGERADATALVVYFTNFEPLLNLNVDKITLESYVPLLRQVVLEKLDDQLRQHPEREAALRANGTLFTRFCALLQLYSPLRALDRAGQDVVAGQYAAVYEKTLVGAQAWLEELSRLVRAAGFASVYVLFDGLDETSRTRKDHALIFRLLNPLLDAPRILQGYGFAFKFFLPQVLKEHMEQADIGRLDRIPHRSLDWSDAQLVAMLGQRLRSHSRISQTSSIGHVNRFADLCETSGIERHLARHNAVDIDHYLVKCAMGSPRRLINLARFIVEHHCELVDDVNTAIDFETIQAGIRCTRVSTSDLKIPLTLDPAQSAPLAHDPVPPLHLNDNGDVTLGGCRILTPLPKQVYTCLHYLWLHRGKVIPYEELDQALYGEKLAEYGDPRSSRTKIVQRLRRALEPEKQNSHTYIDVQHGIGYVLRNYSEQKEGG